LRVAAPPLTNAAHHQAAVNQRKNARSNCSFTHATMIEYDGPHRAAFRAIPDGNELVGVYRPPA
jgi:hypothetical protein